jgi:hypothetical protein
MMTVNAVMMVVVVVVKMKMKRVGFTFFMVSRMMTQTLSVSSRTLSSPARS